MKKVKKVVIPAAGWGTRFLPLTKVVHKELIPVLNKPIIHYLVEEAANAGIQEIILVISPRKLDILKYFSINIPLQQELKLKNKIALLHQVEKTNKLLKISIAIQNEQLGLGHAILMAADLVGNEPFGVILGDDLIDSDIPAIQQLIEAYNEVNTSVIGVQLVKPEKLKQYGVVEQIDPTSNQNLFPIKGAIEKPKINQAPSSQAILGRYVFTPEIFSILRTLKPATNKEINLVDAFAQLLKKQEIYAYQFSGTRYDLGSVEGFVEAQIDYALKNPLIKNNIKNFIKNK